MNNQLIQMKSLLFNGQESVEGKSFKVIHNRNNFPYDEENNYEAIHFFSGEILRIETQNQTGYIDYKWTFNGEVLEMNYYEMEKKYVIRNSDSTSGLLLMNFIDHKGLWLKTLQLKMPQEHFVCGLAREY